MIRIIDVKDFNKITNPLVIDVREHDEYIRGHIPNAKNIPVEEILDNYDKYLNINDTYYVYCETSLRSIRVCEQLSDLGYKVFVINGGYKEWILYNQK